MNPTVMTKDEFDAYVEITSTDALIKEHPYGIKVVDPNKLNSLEEKVDKFFEEENYLQAFGFSMDATDSPALEMPNAVNLRKFTKQLFAYLWS